MEIIDGKKISQDIIEKVGKEIIEKNLNVSLAVILIGDDPASRLYVKLKKKACYKVGIDFYSYKLPKNTSTNEVVEAINFLNQDKDISSILVQLPLPKHLDKEKIINAIDPQKDVDGFHPINLKKYLNGEIDRLPGLNEGIDILLQSTNENLSNKKVCILANSKEFSLPLEKRLQQKSQSVEYTNLKNKNWLKHVKEADVLIVAVGKPLLITADNIKKDVIIIDVGTNKLTKNTVVGDVDFDSVADKCSYITPVPGGVGPITIAMLLKNSVELAQQ